MTPPDELTATPSRGTARAHYPGWHTLANHLTEALVERDIIDTPVDLHRLHDRLGAGDIALDEHYMNGPTRSFYALPQPLVDGYLDLVAFVADQVVHRDLLFQAAPIVRFHFPAAFPPSLRGASGRGIQFHSDTLGGHPFSMLNVWLALTDTGGTNALHLSDARAGIELLTRFAHDLEGVPYDASLAHFQERLRTDPAFEATVAAGCDSVATQAGELVVFDSRCVHGGTENDTDSTRVSIDFRLITLPELDQSAFESALAARHPRWARGQILHPQSAARLRR